MIKVKNLYKSFVSNTSTTDAIKNISFSLEKGDVLGILGPNGAGKSTLIKILSTVLDKDEGEILFDNCSIDEKNNYRKKFTTVMQKSSLELWLNVEENLKIYGKFYGLKNNLLKIEIDKVIKIFGLTQYRQKKVAELSGGYRKRLQLAKCFLIDSPIMLLDEPTVGLDPFSKDMVMNLIKNKVSEGKTILFTTQIINEVELICNKLMVINNGVNLETGNIEEIKQKFDHKKRIKFTFENLTPELYALTRKICNENLIEKQGNSILFNLSMKTKEEKKNLYNLFNTLEPINISVIEPSLKEIFMDIVKEGK